MERPDIMEIILVFFKTISSEASATEINEFLWGQGLWYSERYIQEQIYRLEEKGLVNRQNEGKFVVFSR